MIAQAAAPLGFAAETFLKESLLDDPKPNARGFQICSDDLRFANLAEVEQYPAAITTQINQ